MLVVRIEKWNRGNPLDVQLMGFATIANAGTGGRELGNYFVNLYRPSAEGFRRTIEQMVNHPLRAEAWKKARVDAFPRLRLGPWDLLLRALVAAVQPRNPIVPADTQFGEPPATQVDDDVP